jgi:type IV pilus assembly protein PilV
MPPTVAIDHAYIQPLPNPAKRGFSMLEARYASSSCVFGLLGLIGLQAAPRRSPLSSSYQRGQALILVQDIADRVATNRAAAPAT